MEYLAQNILYSWFYLIYTKLLLEKVGYSWEYPGINMAPPLLEPIAASRHKSTQRAERVVARAAAVRHGGILHGGCYECSRKKKFNHERHQSSM